MYPTNNGEIGEDADLINASPSGNSLLELVVKIRGLFLTIALAVKDIDKTDQAVW